MKVLMTADTVGGVWTYCIDLIKALAPYGVEVTLCTMGAHPGPEQELQIDEIPNVEMMCSGYKLEWMEDPWDDVDEAGKWLLDIENSIQPDIIHLNGYAHASLPWGTPVVVVGHSCVLSWWEAVKYEPAPSSWDIYRERVSDGLRSANMVIAPTAAMLDALKKHYGPFDRSRVVFNSRDMQMFSAGIKEPLVFSAGRIWDEAKNISTLKSAAPGLKWPVFVAGDDKHSDNGSIDAMENVRMLGQLAPQILPYWFARAGIYALPARYEPFGLSALEAALAGCALVLGDIPSLREVWGDAALFVQPDDSSDLQSCINALIDDDSLRLHLSSKSRARALEYTPERQGKAYMDVYNELVRESVLQTAP